jgi:hypothetical protein
MFADKALALVEKTHEGGLVAEALGTQLSIQIAQSSLMQSVKALKLKAQPTLLITW